MLISYFLEAVRFRSPYDRIEMLHEKQLRPVGQKSSGLPFDQMVRHRLQVSKKISKKKLRILIAKFLVFWLAIRVTFSKAVDITKSAPILMDLTPKVSQVSRVTKIVSKLLNAQGYGIAFIGDFTNAVPTQAAINAFNNLVSVRHRKIK